LRISQDDETILVRTFFPRFLNLALHSKLISKMSGDDFFDSDLLSPAAASPSWTDFITSLAVCMDRNNIPVELSTQILGLIVAHQQLHASNPNLFHLHTAALSMRYSQAHVNKVLEMERHFCWRLDCEKRDMLAEYQAQLSAFKQQLAFRAEIDTSAAIEQHNSTVSTRKPVAADVEMDVEESKNSEPAAPFAVDDSILEDADDFVAVSPPKAQKRKLNDGSQGVAGLVDDDAVATPVPRAAPLGLAQVASPTSASPTSASPTSASAPAASASASTARPAAPAATSASRKTASVNLTVTPRQGKSQTTFEYVQIRSLSSTRIFFNST
jgi:hypothetical protein